MNFKVIINIYHFKTNKHIFKKFYKDAKYKIRKEKLQYIIKNE